MGHVRWHRARQPSLEMVVHCLLVFSTITPSFFVELLMIHPRTPELRGTQIENYWNKGKPYYPHHS